MPSVKVEVKWGKEVFKEVEIDLEQPASVLKSQLYSLTGVPPERQKVMGVKGGLLKDDADLAKLGLKPGQKLSLLGTADKVPEAPVQQQTFMEDLPEEEQDTSGAMGQAAGRLGSRCKRCRRRRWRRRLQAVGAATHAVQRRPHCCRRPRCCRHEQVWCGAAEPGQHMLHEQHGAVPIRCARAARQVRCWTPSGCRLVLWCSAALYAVHAG